MNVVLTYSKYCDITLQKIKSAYRVQFIVQRHAEEESSPNTASPIQHHSTFWARCSEDYKSGSVKLTQKHTRT